MTVVRLGAPLAACLAFSVLPAQAQQANMTFFVTSAGPGKGADLGGIAGADQLCQQLAQSAGAGAKTWHAYLSTQGAGAVNARDRIGKGPWMNAKGVPSPPASMICTAPTTSSASKTIFRKKAM